MFTASFFSTFVILFREALEASLIVGIIFTILSRMQEKRYYKDVWISSFLAILASVLAGVGLMALTQSAKGNMEKVIEGGISILACGVLTHMIFWMNRQAKKIKTEIETKIERALTKGEYFTIVSLPFLAVFREGAETVLFLTAIAAKEGVFVSLLGGIAGFLLAVLISSLIFIFGKKISLKSLFQSTGIFLLFVASGLLAYGIHEFQEIGVIPEIISPLWNINHILNEKVGVGAFLKAIFGYNGNPSLIEVISYIIYLSVILFLFRKTNLKGKQMKKTMIIFFILLMSPHGAFAFDDGDFQVWQTESVDWKVKEDWKAKYSQEFYFGNDARDFYYQHYEIGTIYSGLTDWLDVGLSYRLAFEEKNNSWKEEHRPHANAVLKWSYQGFKFSDRSRIEYRIRQDSEDGWRYRNKLTIKFPKVTPWSVTPYVAEELYYDFIATKYNKNRVYGGVSWELLEDVKADIYYLFQTSKSSEEWVETNVLGAKLRLSF